MDPKKVNEINKQKMHQNNTTEKIYKFCPSCKRDYYVSAYVSKCPTCKSKFEYSHKNDIKPNTPTCPTCGSTKLKKISDIKRAGHWLAFGFASKTAQSQFECENCGYKW